MSRVVMVSWNISGWFRRLESSWFRAAAAAESRRCSDSQMRSKQEIWLERIDNHASHERQSTVVTIDFHGQ